MASTKPSERDLRAKLKLILSQVDATARIYNQRDLAQLVLEATATGLTPALKEDMTRHISGPPDVTPVARPGEYAVTNSQIQALRALYTSLPMPRQRRFASILLDQIDERTARVIVHTILELDLLTTLEKFLGGSTGSVAVRAIAWSSIKDALAHEPHRFSEGDLTTLEKMQKTDRKRFPERKQEPEDSIMLPTRYNV